MILKPRLRILMQNAIQTIVLFLSLMWLMIASCAIFVSTVENTHTIHGLVGKNIEKISEFHQNNMTNCHVVMSRCHF
jgi:hypothetical protein